MLRRIALKTVRSRAPARLFSNVAKPAGKVGSGRLGHDEKGNPLKWEDLGKISVPRAECLHSLGAKFTVWPVGFTSSAVDSAKRPEPPCF